MLSRQWQLGEFEGEDNGSPLLVQVKSETTRVTAWQPGDPAAGRPVRPIPLGVPLDPFVEREATVTEARGLRQRAEAGAYLVELLADAGMDARQALIAACPLPVDAPAADANVPPEHNVLPPAVALMTSGAPDSDVAAAQLEAGPPAWLAGASPAAIDAANTWLAWYRANIAPVIDPADDSWIADSLEYRFSLRVGAGDGQMVLRAPAFEGGFIDWHAFDAEPGASLVLEGEAEPPVPEANDLTVFASPLRFSGMPSDRYWQLEDGQVNLGNLEAQPYDLGRLCLAEFALVYGNDWLVVPMDVSAGSFTRIAEVAYTNTFGERFAVPLADDSNRSGRFRLFALSVRGKDTDVPGLLIPPTALGPWNGLFRGAPAMRAIGEMKSARSTRWKIWSRAPNFSTFWRLPFPGTGFRSFPSPRESARLLFARVRCTRRIPRWGHCCVKRLTTFTTKRFRAPEFESGDWPRWRARRTAATCDGSPDGRV
jgi:hypothetical protein